MSEPIDWGREVEESEAALSKHYKDVFQRSKEVKAEKRAASEIAVKKGLPMGITSKIGPYIGKSMGGKKSRRRKTRRGGKKRSTRRR